jgi:hypothetical protein
MSDIRKYSELQKAGKCLGREGISKRIHELIMEYARKHSGGHYRECTMLAGRLHALYLATERGDYWREVADRGFHQEIGHLSREAESLEIPGLSERQVGRLKNAIGVNPSVPSSRWGYRNSFITSPDCDSYPDMENLLDRGYCEVSAVPDSLYLCYRVTRKGCEALGLTEEVIRRALNEESP